MPRYRRIIPVMLIAALGIIAYSNSAQNGFVWDDRYLIVENRQLRDIRHVPHAFTQDLGAGASKEYGFYRPLQIVFLTLGYQFWGLNPAGYRLLNICFHILTALGLFLLLLLLFKDETLAFWTGALFVVHPLHTETVVYIPCMADVLSALWMIACGIFWLRFIEQRKMRDYVACILCFGLGLFSKETAVITPALLALCASVRAKKIFSDGIWKSFIPFVIILILYAGLRIGVVGIVRPPGLSVAGFLERIPGFFVALTGYLKLFFLPADLHMEYGILSFPWTEPRIYIGGIILLGFIAAACIFRRHKIAAFGAGWFLLGMLLHSNLYPVNQSFMLEHWMYLPAMGLTLVSVQAARSLFSNKRALFVLGVCALCLCSMLTIRQSGHWRNEISVYERTLQYTPDNFKVLHNLCGAYFRVERYADAQRTCQRALEIVPDSYLTMINLGRTYVHRGRIEEGIQLYRQAIALHPQAVSAYLNLGIALRKQGDTIGARAALEQAIAVSPDDGEVYNAMGEFLLSLEEPRGAIQYFQKAVRTDPRNYRAAAFYFNLGRAYALTGNQKQATAAYQACLKLDPSFARARE
ncbi:MAG: tetratricopeptide repeat protein [Candidatus Omnitrophica bacterium]|nr:tetratricopeptide repeat protein [Candidatus Omnitrophota bacterium]